MADPNPSPAPNPAAGLTAEQIAAMVAAGSQQQSNIPYSPYGYNKSGPYQTNRWVKYDTGGGYRQTIPLSGQDAYDAHWSTFQDKWQNDANWRAQLLGYAMAAGIPGVNSKSSGYDAFNIWDTAGQLSQKFGMAPMDILKFMAGGGKGAQDLIAQFLSGKGAKAQTHTSTSTNTSYDISNAETAKALTNMVLAAALGREATPEELAQYKAALNASERANPTVSTGTNTTTQDSLGNTTSSSTSSTTSGGLDQAGKEQVLKDKASGTAEGQAYQTNDVFNKALQYLSGL